jgi:hypothetical protein
LLVARAGAGKLALSREAQQSAIASLHQQLFRHGGSSSSSNEPPVGSSGSSGRSLVLAGAAALALGNCGLVGVQLPDLQQPAAEQQQQHAVSGSSSDGGSNEEPPLLQLLFGVAGCKDGRAVLRAVTAVGYIGAGSSSQGLKLTAAKGMCGLEGGGG